MVVPESVHDHAGRERVCWRGDPVGERPAAVVFRGVGRQLPGRAESRQAARGNLLARRHRIAAKEPVGLPGCDKLARVGLGQHGKGLELPREHGSVFREHFELRDFVGRQLGGGHDRADGVGVHVVGRQAVDVGGDQCPLRAVERHGDFILRRQPIGVFGLGAAVAAPDDAADLLHLGQFQLHPAATDLV